ncbi:NAD(P)/FAD-dependent oxidoreductase [Myceligenerans xiligouense]|uniref:NADPH-dependent 2,4-dienoyl-CoA reductase/sulfur reductase-like enzyme n=1 Tax=Myceligenerans xiligouense TaxID=253184 RepID=A0A3N4YFW6_9MICO|nr:FAD/NAD(P)-binding oxidoreductase [Myceligenerans xiligouense]RPF19713.1 NADPH-dependent 2,4-dienoyl-CoA reductase/sulfur reductase-like enzyme [Myceligenerans xiligouense]
MEPIVLVGGGLASARAAETLRAEGYDGDVVVVTGEAHQPYERPPLSKDFLRAESERDVVFPLAEDWYDKHGVEVRTGTLAVGLDAADHVLTFADGVNLSYSRCLLATGSSPRPLDVPGTDLSGVHYLRTLDDADRLARVILDCSLEGTGRVAVVGDGWIGLEVAASARTLGLDVTVVGQNTAPLVPVLGPEMAELFADLHAEHGTRLIRETSAVRLVGSESRVVGVELDDATEIDADIVVIGVGATPNVGLAEVAGLDLRPAGQGGGIAVDGTLRTSHPDVFAAGDVASIPSPHYGRPIRVEHWAAANDGGVHAARAMLGANAPYDNLPFFFSDQYDLGMEYLGWVEAGKGYDDVVVAGSARKRELVAFWVRDGRVLAGMAVNVWDQVDRIKELILGGREVPREELEKFTAS